MEQALRERNSTLLMWVGINHGLEGTPAEFVFDYYSQYLFDTDIGYYWEGNPKFDHQVRFVFLGTMGVINLKTGELMHWYGGPPPTHQQILDLVDQANQS